MELSEAALEKAARAAFDEWHPGAIYEAWAETTQGYRDGWTAVARAAITTYHDATTPLAFFCTACRTGMSWVLAGDPPSEIQCFCGAMVPAGAPDAR